MKEFIRKNCANFFSVIRIVGALYLLLTDVGNDFTPKFLILYAIFCSTDAIDGFLARKLNISSVLGVTLDTIGDGLIGFTPVKVLVIQKLIPGWFYVLLGVTVAVFAAAAVVAQIKFKKFTFPHTYFGKLNGCCVASSPFLFHIVPLEVLFIIVGGVFFFAGVETLIIVIKLKELKPFVPSVFHTDYEPKAKETAAAENK
ncbi:MAG: CDP-alcohol phosphatidyltransferase family protein [Ruminococcaceae bacterium]|nr:CDP-alcohol phosphatidyltransferase family protein [Oscillospiraceae bacterium]